MLTAHIMIEPVATFAADRVVWRIQLDHPPNTFQVVNLENTISSKGCVLLKLFEWHSKQSPRVAFDVLVQIWHHVCPVSANHVDRREVA